LLEKNAIIRSMNSHDGGVAVRLSTSTAPISPPGWRKSDFRLRP